MAGLFNQSEKINTIIFIVLLIVYAFAFSIYLKSHHFTQTHERIALGFFTAVLIFGPALYGLFSQNIKKSFLFAGFAALPFLWSAFIGYQAMIAGSFANNFYMFVGSNLFSFAVFLITGILTAWLGAVYQSDKIDKFRFGSYKLSDYNLICLVLLLAFSFLFLITGSLEFGLHLH